MDLAYQKVALKMPILKNQKIWPLHASFKLYKNYSHEVIKSWHNLYTWN